MPGSKSCFKKKVPTLSCILKRLDIKLYRDLKGYIEGNWGSKGPLVWKHADKPTKKKLGTAQALLEPLGRRSLQEIIILRHPKQKKMY